MSKLPHPSKIVIGSRRSALARLQSYAVAQHLRALYPDLKIEFLFKESLGDKNLDSPLWQMPEKGVFTKDLQIDLLEGRCDVVVHSWKDLPVEVPEGSELAATLKSFGIETPEFVATQDLQSFASLASDSSVRGSGDFF